MSKKQTKKEIENTLRGKLAHQHNLDIEHYKERIKKLAEENYGLQKKMREKNEEVLALKEKVDQYEDWIRRLQEFCDMPEDEREKAVKAYQEENKYKIHMNDFWNNPAVKMYTELFNMMV